MSDQYSFNDAAKKIQSFFYADRKPDDPLSYESLLARRKIAEALLGKRSPFPKTIGEGLTTLGEAIGDRQRLSELDAGERAYEKEYGVTADTAARLRARGGFTEPSAPPPPEATPASYVPPPNPEPSVPPPERGYGARTLPPTLQGQEFAPPSVPPDALLNTGRNMMRAPGAVQTPDGAERAVVPQAGRPGSGRIEGPAVVRPPIPAAVGPGSSLTPGRDALTMAALAQRGVIPPDPMEGTETPSPGPSTAALDTGETATDAPPIGPPGAQLAQAAPFGDRFGPPANPMIPAPEIRTLPPPAAPPAPPAAAAPVASRFPMAPVSKPSELEDAPPAFQPTPQTKEEIQAIREWSRISSPNDPRKALWASVITAKQAERKQADDAKMEVFKNSLANRLKQQEYNRAAPKLGAETEEISLKNDEAIRQAAFANQMGGLPKDVTDAVKKNYIEVRKPAVETLAAGQAAIRQARLALSQGAVIGVGADARINWGRLMTLMGYPDKGSDAANSQQFKIIMQPVANAARVAAAGNNNISDADTRNALQSVAADFNLDPRTIHNVLNILEDNGVEALKDYKAKSSVLFGTEKHPALEAAFGAPRFEVEPQRLPAPPRGTRVQVWSARDADRYPPGTLIISPNGKHGMVP